MNRVWALAPGYGAEARQIAIRVSEQKREPIVGAVWLDDVTSQDDMYENVGGIALINVEGILFPELPFYGCCYATGYNCIRIAAGEAFLDPTVRALALVIDSPGGMVSGCFELVEWMRAAAIVAKKPVVAIVKDTAASAAYALACATDTISMPKTGAVGSIGVVRLHIDISKMMEMEGSNISLIYSGARKVDGNPFQPLPRDIRDEWQGDMDDYRQIFAEAVAGGRPMTIEAALATEARLYEGPRNAQVALGLGLVDAIASPEDALTALVKAVSH